MGRCHNTDLGAHATFDLPSDEKGNALKLKYCSRPSQVLTESRMVPVRVKRNQMCDMTCFLTKLWISCF